MFFWAFLLAARRSRRATGYAIASETPHAASLLRTLRMPNAKEVFFMRFRVYPPTRPRVKNEVKNTSFLYSVRVFARAGRSPRPRIYSQNIKKQYFIQITKSIFFTLFPHEG